MFATTATARCSIPGVPYLHCTKVFRPSESSFMSSESPPPASYPWPSSRPVLCRTRSIASTSCVLQCQPKTFSLSCVTISNRTGRWNVLSAGEEPALLRHHVAHLLLGADLPDNGNNTGHDGTDDGGVTLPVRGLGVPTTGRRPDVLGVAIVGIRGAVFEGSEWFAFDGDMR